MILGVIVVLGIILGPYVVVSFLAAITHSPEPTLGTEFEMLCVQYMLPAIGMFILAGYLLDKSFGKWATVAIGIIFITASIIGLMGLLSGLLFTAGYLISAIGGVMLIYSAIMAEPIADVTEISD